MFGLHLSLNIIQGINPPFGWTSYPFFWGFVFFFLHCLEPCCFAARGFCHTIDSGAMAEKHTTKPSVKIQSKFSQNSVKIQPRPFKGCAPEVCANVAVGSLWPTPLAAVSDPCFWFITGSCQWPLVLVYHCCVSAQTFELPLQNTLGDVQSFCCPPHLSEPCWGGWHQAGRRDFHWWGWLLANITKKSDLFYIFFLQDQLFCPCR